MASIIVAASNSSSTWKSQAGSQFTCSGTSDNRSTIQSAFTSAGSGGTVTFAPGTYYCAGELSIPGTLGLFEGQGMGPKGEPTGEETDFRFTADSGLKLASANVECKNFRISGAGHLRVTSSNHNISNVMVYKVSWTQGNTGSFVIDISSVNVSGITYTNCIAWYPDRYGFLHSNFGSGKTTTVSNVMYDRCEAWGCGVNDRKGAHVSSPSNWPTRGCDWQNGFDILETPPSIASNITYKNCIADGNWEGGWYSERDAICRNIKLVDCVARNNGQQSFLNPSWADIGQGSGYILNCNPSSSSASDGITLTRCSAVHHPMRHMTLYTYSGTNVTLTDMSLSGGCPVGIGTAAVSSGTGMITINGQLTISDITGNAIAHSNNSTAGCSLKIVAPGPFSISGNSNAAAIRITHDAATSRIESGTISGFATGIQNTGSGTLQATNVRINGATTPTSGNVSWTQGEDPQTYPDLIISEIGAPDDVVEGDSIVFSATVLNQGSASTPSGVSHRVKFAVDGVTVGYSAPHSASMGIGSSSVMMATTAWVATAGTHTVVATADADGAVPESQDTNNSSQISVTVAGTVEPDPLEPSFGQITYTHSGYTYTFTCQVHNPNTDQSLTVAPKWVLRQGQTVVDMYEPQSLTIPASANRATTYSVVLQPGKYRLCCGDSVETTPIPGTPSIQVTSPTSASSWARGSSQSVTWTYTGEVGSAASIFIWRSGEYIETIAGVPIGIGGIGSYSWTIPASYTAGRYTIGVRSDASPTIKDTTDSFVVT